MGNGKIRTLKCRKGGNRFRVLAQDGEELGHFIILVESNRTFIEIMGHQESLILKPGEG